MSYADDLKRVDWQRKRLKIMERDGWACGATDRVFNVHHKRYIAGNRAWDYPDDNLETLCEPCHEAKHDGPEIDFSALSLVELRAAVGRAMQAENAAQSDREKRQHGAFQEQAWKAIFSARLA
jgi:5-methylcytosine-specific restriction endonuclease McrA